MDLLRSLLDLIQRKQQKPPKLGPTQQKTRTKSSRSRRAGAAKTGGRRGKRELTAAQAVREAELRG
jgi:hypothetical protein